VLHALELCWNDVQRFCEGLSGEELNTRPFGLPPVAFHLKHIARSTDRLLSYAEGRALSDDQLAAKQSELDATSTREQLFSELDAALKRSAARIRGFSPSRLDEVRLVGQKQLPTTVAGLLVHVADHMQRHVGQAVTTSKIVLAQRR
jgi:uncharacterized damage-inducible protein DinB